MVELVGLRCELEIVCCLLGRRITTRSVQVRRRGERGAREVGATDGKAHRVTLQMGRRDELRCLAHQLQ